MNDILFHILGLLFPARCPLCSQIVQRQAALCQSCKRTAPWIVDGCTGCGCPKNECSCGKNGFELNIVSPFEYDGAVRDAIHAFKFGGELEHAQYFGEEMGRAVKAKFGDVDFDLAVCVPQTKRRLRERGFNQSAMLTKRCAKFLEIPSGTNTLLKLHDTADQHTLKARDRQKNVKGVFQLSPKADVKGKTVLLCDDIKTTGATLNECRKILTKAGAKEVYCATLAVVVERLTPEPK